jgi:ribosomal protein S20
MANTKQAIKMVRKTVRRTSYNKWWKNQVRSAYKSVMTLLNTEKPAKSEANTKIAELQKKIDKSIKAKIVSKHKGARMKSQAMKKAKTLN